MPCTCPRRLPFVPLLLALLVWLALWPGGLQAQSAGFLRILGQVAPDGTSISLDWAGADPARTGTVVVSRRQLGQRGAESWQEIDRVSGTRPFWVDRTTQPGIAYEYRLERQELRDGSTVDLGYWTGGVQVPAVQNRGIALLVVDESLAEALAPRIDRFEMDLIGDGWQVRRLSAPRGTPADPVANLAAARGLRARIDDAYRLDADRPHALILVGHVPLVRSGRTAPDGHEADAIGTDLFYADLDGRWPDDGNGVLRPNHVPGGEIKMRVGRIDFSTLTASWGQAETDLLRAYLDRNHAWRQGAHGDLREAYGKTHHLRGEIDGVLNVVGPEGFTEGGHHDAGTRQPWLLGVDFGDWKGRNYAGYAIKPVFAINFGSSKQKIGRNNNAMNGLLAQPWYPLAVGWGARPTWRLHHMAMGMAMGESHLRTVNNGLPWRGFPETMEYRPTGLYLFRNPIWVNLLGDPTARPFPLAPPRGLTARETPAGIALSWQAPDAPEVTGYMVYRAGSRTGPYRPLTEAGALTGTEFADPDGSPDHWYMVRAHGLKSVAAGSFHALSQGSFARAGGAPVAAPDLTVTVRPGQEIAIFPPAGPPGATGPIRAPVAGAEGVEPVLRDGIWTLTTDEGFTGPRTFRYTASDGLTTDVGQITVAGDDG